MTLPQGQDVGFQPEGLWATSLGLSLGGRNQFLKAIGVASVTFSFAAVAAASVSEQAVTVPDSTPFDVAAVIATGVSDGQYREFGHWQNFRRRNDATALHQPDCCRGDPASSDLKPPHNGTEA